ncbi:FAD-dependent oxidoreductase [Streptomyces sp. NPDC058001]|uniref:FAD-dependent oxidoreductase n=1 Tax=Streptomyces sp. NPDC058001 TaxID=3346300 RepID=UPI0036EEEC74
MIVVGSGVIGLTTAVVLAERGHSVLVRSREPAGRTTSAVAGALWWPYRIRPEDRVGDWSLESFAVYGELADRPEETGVRMVEGVHEGGRLDGLGAWAADVPELRVATASECRSGEGLWARLPLIDMPTHLRWLGARLAAAGGAVETGTVTSLASLAGSSGEARVVVNCAGLGARDLVPDPAVRPVRGQLVLVENPGVDTWYTGPESPSGGSTYFFPQPGRLVLGGTAQEDDWSTEPDPVVADAIVRRCAAVRPEIAGARILGHRVGLRPVRDAVRLERVRLPGGGTVVHHYGHGGAGVTVAWGCAREAADLVESGDA